MNVKVSLETQITILKTFKFKKRSGFNAINYKSKKTVNIGIKKLSKNKTKKKKDISTYHAFQSG